MGNKRNHGHYCKVCNEYKANEKFTGKGHKNHVCKKCTSSTKKLPESIKANQSLYESKAVVEEQDFVDWDIPLMEIEDQDDDLPF